MRLTRSLVDYNVDLSKRRFMQVGGIAGLGLLTTACPFDGVTKDKAVRYAGIAIDYLKDILPILSQIGGNQVIDFVNKAIPTLEKLKDALQNSEFPTASNLFDTVTATLGQIATALLQLPESARRDTVIGIVTLVNVSLRTVRLFVDTGTSVSAAATPRGVGQPADANALRKAFDATRF